MMSQSRSNEQPPVSSTSHLYKAFKTGMLTGLGNALILYPFDKIGFIAHTKAPEDRQLKQLAEPKKFFQGFNTAAIHAVTKTTCIFTVRQEFLNLLNKYSPDNVCNNFRASFAAGFCSVYLTSPLSVLKALKFDGKNVTPKDFFSNFREIAFRGAHMTAARDAIATGTFFGSVESFTNWCNGNVLLGGACANIVGSFLSKPFAVIADKQKISPKVTVMKAVSEIYHKQGGLRGFFAFWPQTTMARMGVQGAVTSGLMRWADRMFQKDEPKTTLTR